MFYLFAQSVDPTGVLAGGSGWIGVGLLGLVLAWLLFKHLPDKDKQLKELLDRHDEQMEHKREAYQHSLDTVVTHCEKETAAVTATFREELNTLSDAIKELGRAVRGEKFEGPR